LWRTEQRREGVMHGDAGGGFEELGELHGRCVEGLICVASAACTDSGLDGWCAYCAAMLIVMLLSVPVSTN
jgi:hypothetical protein